jgi:hypothetical protein
VRAFLQRFPWVHVLTAWDEPNHPSQPTFAKPQLAADYYNMLREECPACVITAGDLLDGPNLSTWLADYRPALAEHPAVWGLHNYYDATYFSSDGVDTILNAVSGRLWLTETGGIVRFSPDGASGLPYDETRAADSIRFLYTMTATRPRIDRMYIYQWQALPGDKFDAGLVRPDGTPRPGLEVVRDFTRAAAQQSASQVAVGRVRIAGRGVRLLAHGRLRVRLTCVFAARQCSGQADITTAKSRVAAKRRIHGRVPLIARVAYQIPVGFTRTYELSVRAVVRHELLRRPPRRLYVRACDHASGGCEVSAIALIRPSQRRRGTR